MLQGLEQRHQGWDQYQQGQDQYQLGREQIERAEQNQQQIQQAFEQHLQGWEQHQQAWEQLMRGTDSPGLSPERIERFEHFAADESLVGEQCIVCLEDLEIGTQIVRLDCHVSHYLCKTCTDEWFKNHNTCPTCNHIFN